MLIAGLIFVLSLIIIRPQDFVLELVGSRIVLYSMTALLIAWIASPLKKNLICTTQDKFISLFFCAFILSTLSVGWISFSISIFVETLKLALIYFFVATVIRNTSHLRSVTWSLVFLLTALAGSCILQHYGWDITGARMLWSPLKKVWQIRGIGIFDNPNDIAYALIFVVPFYLSALVSSNRLYRFGSLVLLIVSIYAIYLTESRGGYLATFSCFFFWIIGYMKSRKVRRVLIPVAFVVLIVAFLVKSAGYHHDESSMGRVDAWSVGMTMFKEHPLIGVGKYQFFEHHKIDSHNSFVRAGAELGLLGLYSFVGILLYSIKSLLRPGGNTPGINIYRLSYLAYLGSYIVGSIFSTRTYDLMFIVVIAITSAIERLAAAETPAGDPVSYPRVPLFISRQAAVMTILCILAWKLSCIILSRGLI